MMRETPPLLILCFVYICFFKYECYVFVKPGFEAGERKKKRVIDILLDYNVSELLYFLVFCNNSLSPSSSSFASSIQFCSPCLSLQDEDLYNRILNEEYLCECCVFLDCFLLHFSSSCYFLFLVHRLFWSLMLMGFFFHHCLSLSISVSLVAWCTSFMSSRNKHTFHHLLTIGVVICFFFLFGKKTRGRGEENGKMCV